MNYLIFFTTLFVFLGISFIFSIRERRLRKRAEYMLRVVRQIGEIDDRIYRMRCDDPEDWPGSREAQMLISKRLLLHEEYSRFLGHQPLRDCEYTTELRNTSLSPE